MEAIHILLAEDNEGDIVLTREALEETKLVIRLSVVKDGKEAIDFVKREGKYNNAELPDLVLLDVNLPKKNGHEVLQYIKGDATLKRIPVVMLTTSSFKKDIDLAYDNFANFYIIKPTDMKDFVVLADVIGKFIFF